MDNACELISQVRHQAVEDRRSEKISANERDRIVARCGRIRRFCTRIQIISREWVIRPPGEGDTTAIGESIAKLRRYVRRSASASAAISALGEILAAAGEAVDEA